MNRSLFITNDFPPMLGGLATLYSRLCAAAPLDRVLVLAPGVRGGALFDQKQPYRILRRWAPTNIHPIVRLLQVGSLLVGALRAVPRERISRIHLGHLYLGPIGLVVKRLYKTPYIIYLHGGDMAGYTRWRTVRRVVGAILRSAELVVVNSAFTRDYYRGLGFDLPRVEILTMPVSLERFSPDLDVAPVRLRYGLDGARVLLTVGRLVARKGHDLVIKSLPRVVESVGDVRYIIVGSGPEEERLRALTQAMNCAERVIFARSVSDEEIPLLYAACDVFVMPSRALATRDGVEGFGIVFLEAGASGKPVVGGRSGGISEAVVDGTTGLLVDPFSTNELESTLITLLGDRGQAKRLGAEGRVRAERLESAWVQAVERIWIQ
jgi:phosphatidylinositol alpha-1,6-mannosyltransferase